MSAEALPAGVVFDCDGTLADTEPLSARAWAEVLADHGVEATDNDQQAIIGRAWPAGFDHFSARADLGDRDRFRERLRSRAVALFTTELELFPDAVATLVALTDAGVPVAVASSSTRAHVLRCLDRGDLTHRVAAVVGADDVTEHKPHPEPYRVAATALGLPPARCTAIEDTPIGVASARAAGSFTVAVLRGVIDGDRLGAADRVVDTIDLPTLIPPESWRSPAA